MLPCRCSGAVVPKPLLLPTNHPPVQGVANRDLKLENLLLDQDQASGNPLLKICDFGELLCLALKQKCVMPDCKLPLW